MIKELDSITALTLYINSGDWNLIRVGTKFINDGSPLFIVEKKTDVPVVSTPPKTIEHKVATSIDSANAMKGFGWNIVKTYICKTDPVTKEVIEIWFDMEREVKSGLCEWATRFRNVFHNARSADSKTPLLLLLSQCPAPIRIEDVRWEAPYTIHTGLRSRDILDEEVTIIIKASL